jgi:hypothetical protein
MRKKLLEVGKKGYTKSFLLPAPLSVPFLSTPQELATTPVAEREALKMCLFLPIPSADLSDIPAFEHPAEKSSSSTITLDEIASALSKAHPHKAPGPDGLPIFILKLLGKPLL